MNRNVLSLLLLLTAALALALAGCSSGFAPTLPSPNEGPGLNQATTTLTPELAGIPAEELPQDLTSANFAVSINGAPARVIRVVRSASGGLAIGMIIDSTGSMGGEIEGVVNSIEAFADSFAGRTVTWGGIEYGDGTPEDGENTWDFFGDLDRRTKVGLTTNLTTFRDWLATLTARGGGDAAENPLDAMMEAKNTMAWPAGVARHFIVLTDVGAHQRGDPPPDGAPPDLYGFTGAEVLDAFRGWAVVHAVSSDYSAWWPTPESASVTANNGGPEPQVTTSGGWDVRELADGGPPGARTHNGTGGKWVEMPASGVVDLTTLGIAELINLAYTVTFERPAGLDEFDLEIVATWAGGSATWTIPGFRP
jgi:hypothetical protein